MSSTDMTLRMMLNNIDRFNTVGPRPLSDRTLPMYTPRSSFSLAMELVTKHRLSIKPDGQDITSYQDRCILTAVGVRHLNSLNQEFRRDYLF